MSDELIARLRYLTDGSWKGTVVQLADQDAVIPVDRALLREAADALGLAERVVEGVRREHTQHSEAPLTGDCISYACRALVEISPAPISTDVNTRPCPSSVSFCGGPDRYGDTCAGCLATWTEEAKEKANG